MTKRDFQLIADVIADTPHMTTNPHAGPIVREDRANIANAMADALAKDHPRFKREVFLAACGIYRDDAAEVERQILADAREAGRALAEAERAEGPIGS